jgi:uncharacterized protein
LNIVVSDTSPIRALSCLGHIGLLGDLYENVLVPPTVLRELETLSSKLPPISLQGIRFLHVQAPANQRVVDDLKLALDAGEAEAIALALEIGADALLIDETAGRSEARRRGLAVTGVLGILIDAKKKGLLQAVAPLVDRLQGELDFFISSALRAEILKLAGE